MIQITPPPQKVDQQQKHSLRRQAGKACFVMSNVTMMGRNEKQRVGPDESCVCGVTRQDTIRRKVGVNSEVISDTC